MITKADISGLILAGGQGRRMGGRDKGLEPFAGHPLVVHVRERLVDSTAELMINANRHLERYGDFADRVILDEEGGYQGPLMGIYSGLRACRTPWMVVVPCDSPALPRDLVMRLLVGIGGADIAVAHDGDRLHPVVALIRTTLVDDLGISLTAGERKIDRWYDRHVWCPVDFSDCPEAFANLNTVDDKQHLEAALRKEFPIA